MAIRKIGIIGRYYRARAIREKLKLRDDRGSESRIASERAPRSSFSSRRSLVFNSVADTRYDETQVTWTHGSAVSLGRAESRTRSDSRAARSEKCVRLNFRIHDTHEPVHYLIGTMHNHRADTQLQLPAPEFSCGLLVSARHPQ